MTAPIRMGVAGAGALGYHHVRILRELEGVAFQGFVDVNPERASEVSRDLGVRAYPALEALLDDVDALTIVVPTPAHFEVAREALRRGVHVLIEKPITATLDQADELLAIAERTSATVQIGHVERFNRAVRAALPHIGSPRFVQVDRLAPFSPRGADVAVVLDLMIHDLDLVLTLIGSPVTAIAAVGVPVLTPSVDIANARLAFETGAVATITASRVSRERTRKLRLFQPSGYLSLDLGAGTGEFYRLRDDVDLAALAGAPRTVDAFVERLTLEAPEGEPLRLEFVSFLASLRGERPVEVSGRAGRDALDVAMRIVEEIERTLPALTGQLRA
ncbi:MAG TPA: Gfo/Idh/MocA family oxidoreductase [Gemmatimonadaceae bacterium]|nr:Gfo/Idh/MocA family oxidoreductase [Gemmatimonadaceae bacterium]